MAPEALALELNTGKTESANPFLRISAISSGKKELEIVLDEIDFSDGKSLAAQNVNISLPFTIPLPPSQRTQRPQFRETEMKWLEQHQEDLKRLEGNWVVLEGNNIVASGKNYKVVIQEARNNGIAIPFIFFVSSEEEKEFAGV